MDDSWIIDPGSSCLVHRSAAPCPRRLDPFWPTVKSQSRWFCGVKPSQAFIPFLVLSCCCLKALSLSPFSPPPPSFHWNRPVPPLLHPLRPSITNRLSGCSSQDPCRLRPGFLSLSPSSSLLHEPRLLESLLTLPPLFESFLHESSPSIILFSKEESIHIFLTYSSYYPHNHYHHITSRYWGALGVCIFPVSWLSP